jgi:competence protein ComEC
VAVLPAWRARAGRALDRLFGRDAALARALVIADARAIDASVRDRYADAGLVHALSVSGLHVAIIAAALELLLRAGRVSRAAAGPAATLAVGVYVALIGAPAPAVRAGVMLAASALARAVQRPTSPWAVFALGAAAPLVEPRAVLDLGYQLSVAGMAALVAGRQSVAELRRFARAPVPSRGEPRVRRALRQLARGARRGWRGTMLGEVVVGVYAAAATAPLVAWHFGRVSVVGVAANLAAGPLLALIQPALFLALLLAPTGPLGQFVADAARPLLRALDAVAWAAARLPGGVARSAPTALGAACAGAAALALLAAAAARRRRGRWALAGVGALAAAAWTHVAPAGGGEVELHAIDVGQGDALALRTPRGRWVLFDAGRGGRGSDAGGRVVVPYLRRRGGDVVALVLSHPHADHVGGAASVVRRLRPTAVWDAGFALGSDTYREVLTAAREAGARWHRVRPGDSLAVDGVVLTVLAPDSAWTAALDDPNLASVVVSARYGGVRFLLTGDAEAPEERWLARRARADPQVAAALRADVLKVAHHGSRTSTSPEFLALVRPRVALVSVGAGNSYGHPSPEVVWRMRAAGAEVLRTDAEGAIVVRTDGRRVRVQTSEGTWDAAEGVDGRPQDRASSAPR